MLTLAFFSFSKKCSRVIEKSTLYHCCWLGKQHPLFPRLFHLCCWVKKLGIISDCKGKYTSTIICSCLGEERPSIYFSLNKRSLKYVVFSSYFFLMSHRKTWSISLNTRMFSLFTKKAKNQIQKMLRARSQRFHAF